MKDKFKDGALYYVLFPGTDELLLAKASTDSGRRANFFFCDKGGFIRWEKIEHACRVALRAPSHIEIATEDDRDS